MICKRAHAYVLWRIHEGDVGCIAPATGIQQCWPVKNTVTYCFEKYCIALCLANCYNDKRFKKKTQMDKKRSKGYQELSIYQLILSVFGGWGYSIISYRFCANATRVALETSGGFNLPPPTNTPWLTPIHAAAAAADANSEDAIPEPQKSSATHTSVAISLSSPFPPVSYTHLTLPTIYSV